MEGLQDAIAGAVTPLEQTREKLAEKEKAIAADLAEVREGLRTIDRIIRAAGLSPAKDDQYQNGHSRNGAAVKRKEHASPEALGRVAAAIGRLGEKDFTINQVAGAAGGMDKSVVSRALDDLRDEGKVRLVGRGWPNGEKKGRQSNMYRAVG